MYGKIGFQCSSKTNYKTAAFRNKLIKYHRSMVCCSFVANYCKISASRGRKSRAQCLQNHSTRSPTDVVRCTSIGDKRLLFTTFGANVAPPPSPDASRSAVVSASAVLLAAMCGSPLVKPCCGAASGTMRLRKPAWHPHGNILHCEKRPYYITCTCQLVSSRLKMNSLLTI